MQRWESWSGLEAAHPAQVLTPASPAEVVDAVVAARAHGLGVKMVGSGHSFTGIAVFSTGLVAGVAPGAAVVGVVVDAHGASASFWVPVAAGACGAVLALATSAARRAVGSPR